MSPFAFFLKAARLSALALLALGPAGAAASKWVKPAKAEADSSFQLDLTSATRSGGTASLWVRVAAPADRKASDHRMLLRFDCATWRVATIAWARHDSRGAKIDSGAMAADADTYRHVESGPEAEAARLACNGKAETIAAEEEAAPAAAPKGKRVNIDHALRTLGGRVTSSTRTREEQRLLYAAGKTRLLDSAHLYGRARDIVGLDRDKILHAVRQAGLTVRKLVWETGEGAFQGTGAHWHLEWEPGS